nr:unnamed protein product [Callosobruchus chinensis]
MIWHEQVSSIVTGGGKKLEYLFRVRKYFSPVNLLTLALYKAKIRSSLEYCAHIREAAAPTTFLLPLMQSMQGQLDSSKIIDAAEKMRQNLRTSVAKTDLRKRLRMCVRNHGGHVENELK